MGDFAFTEVAIARTMPCRPAQTRRQPELTGKLLAQLCADSILASYSFGTGIIRCS